MPWHLLPWTVELLPVHSLLYCLILIFVSAIKFFLVFIHDFGYFKLFQPRIELMLCWGNRLGWEGLERAIFQGEIFFLFSSHPWKTNPPLTLHFCHPWGLKYFGPNNLNSNHEPDIENNLFDILICRKRRMHWVEHCKNPSGIIIPDKLLIIPDKLLIGNG